MSKLDECHRCLCGGCVVVNQGGSGNKPSRLPSPQKKNSSDRCPDWPGVRLSTVLKSTKLPSFPGPLAICCSFAQSQTPTFGLRSLPESWPSRVGARHVEVGHQASNNVWASVPRVSSVSHLPKWTNYPVPRRTALHFMKLGSPVSVDIARYCRCRTRFAPISDTLSSSGISIVFHPPPKCAVPTGMSTNRSRKACT